MFGIETCSFRCFWGNTINIISKFKKKQSLLLPGASQLSRFWVLVARSPPVVDNLPNEQWYQILYYHCLWGQLSTTCSNAAAVAQCHCIASYRQWRQRRYIQLTDRHPHPVQSSTKPAGLRLVTTRTLDVFLCSVSFLKTTTTIMIY